MVRVNVSLSKADLESLDKLAGKTGLTRSALVRVAVVGMLRAPASFLPGGPTETVHQPDITGKGGCA